LETGEDGVGGGFALFWGAGEEEGEVDELDRVSSWSIVEFIGGKCTGMKRLSLFTALVCGAIVLIGGGLKVG
jgi:hypothetical protein